MFDWQLVLYTGLIWSIIGLPLMLTILLKHFDSYLNLPLIDKLVILLLCGPLALVIVIVLDLYDLISDKLINLLGDKHDN